MFHGLWESGHRVYIEGLEHQGSFLLLSPCLHFLFFLLLTVGGILWDLGVLEEETDKPDNLPPLVQGLLLIQSYVDDPCIDSRHILKHTQACRGRERETERQRDRERERERDKGLHKWKFDFLKPASKKFCDYVE
jgi:hypothetical protein